MELLKTVTKVVKTTTNTFKTKYDNILIVETITNGRKSITIKNDKIKEYGHLIIIKDEFYDFIKKNNPFNNSLSELSIDIEKLNIDEIYDKIQNGEFVYLYMNGHIIFNSDGKPLPYAREFDYISTILNNRSSDIDGLFNHLKTHEWVVNKDELEIEDIPYYNAEHDYNKFISLIIYPDTDVYQELYEKFKDTKYPSTKMDMFISNYNNYNEYDPMGLLPFIK